jgi:MFS family permease
MGRQREGGHGVAVRRFRRRSAAGAAALGGVATVVCLLPAFLAGALAVQLRRDLAFGAAALGVAVALFRAAGAMTSPYLGGLADRLGATRSLRLATSISAVSSLGIALTARSWGLLAAWLMLAGTTNAFVQPAANRLLVRRVPAARLGAAFGVKQSAPPTASTLAGISLPVVALTLGWRWAYALAALLAVAVAAITGPPPPKDQRPREPTTDSDDLPPRRTILLFATAFALGTTCSTSVTTFYVTAATEAGTSAQLAGTMLAVASVTAVAVRLTAGVASDHVARNHLRICAALMTTGSIGMAVLSTAQPRLMAVGVVVALAGAWGFNGVFLFALVRAFSSIPGKITGVVAPGALLGGTLGPPLFGFISEISGYPVAWRLTSAVALAAATTMLVANRRLAAYAPTASR